MIDITFYLKKNCIEGFKITGHAGYDEKGYDIVCSAVSVLSQSVVVGFESVLETFPDYKIDDKGFMEFHIPDDKMKIDNFNILLRTFKTTLEILAEDYSDYIIITELEV